MSVSRHLRMTGLLLLLLACGGRAAQGQPTLLWSGSGPEGGRILDLESDPDDPGRILAATDFGGVYISRDHGHSWVAEADGLELLTIHDVVAVPGWSPLLFAATSAGVFRYSSDFHRWSPRSSGLAANAVHSLAVDPDAPWRMLAGTSDGVFLTENFALGWTAVNTGLGALDVEGVCWDTARDRVFVATATGGVFAASETDWTWSPANAGLADLALNTRTLCADPLVPEKLWLATAGGVFTSVDDGASWQPRSAGLPSLRTYDLWVDPVDGDHLMVGTEEGAAESQDGGASWTPLLTGLVDRSVQAILHTGQELLAGTFHRGVYRLGGGQWVPSGEDLNNTLLWRVNFAAGGDRLLVAGYGGLFRSENGGAGFTFFDTGLAAHPDIRTVVASPTDPQRLYAASNYGGVYRSTDGGASFTLVGLSGETVRDLLCHPADGNILWAATYAGVFYSTDGGGTWQQRNTGLQVVRVNNLEMDPQDPSTLYCGTYLGYAYKSTNGGQSWSLINQGLGADIIFDLDVSPFESDLIVTGGIETKGVWRSTDGGATWSSASIGLANKSVWSVEFDPHDPDRVFAGTQGGVAVSYDGGLTWQDFSEGLIISDIRDVKVHPSDPATVFVASYGGGLFVHTEGVTDAPRVAPVAALLRPNYPNPFNPSTTLAFEIEGSDPAPVRLEVYDLRGRRVAGLVDERLAPGLYRRTWNALDGTGARVASGSYLAVLRVDGAVAGTRKMTLVQ